MRRKIGLDFVLGECVSLLERNDSDLIRQHAANRRLRGGYLHDLCSIARTFTARTYVYSENVRLQREHMFTARAYVYS